MGKERQRLLSLTPTFISRPLTQFLLSLGRSHSLEVLALNTLLVLCEHCSEVHLCLYYIHRKREPQNLETSPASSYAMWNSVSSVGGLSRYRSLVSKLGKLVVCSTE